MSGQISENEAGGTARVSTHLAPCTHALPIMAAPCGQRSRKSRRAAPHTKINAHMIGSLKGRSKHWCIHHSWAGGSYSSLSPQDSQTFKTTQETPCISKTLAFLMVARPDVPSRPSLRHEN